ncbi:TIGR03643 family protein [Flavobacterium noncentrifugens]|nr:TIGR03643 family protein [Flavobacterium noncentrifugens]GEP52660.1 TIGR03643 family protein [Flavobacterium noncentrifugens]
MSEEFKSKFYKMRTFSIEEIDRIIEMAWEDRTPFDIIKLQFNLSQGDVEKLMRKELKHSSFKRWRKRVSSGVGVKHLCKANENMLRFKCTRQRMISNNKISKR